MEAMMVGRFMIGVVALAIGVAACGGDKGNGDLHLDSAGAKIQRGVKEVGQKLDTAWTDVKTGVNEAQIQGALHRLNGLDSVKVDLTPEGQATLTGSVATEDRRRLAETVVRETRGVKSVTNNITFGAIKDSTIADSTGNTHAYSKQDAQNPAKR
jgi:osmotically-inducible protein OsmY